MKARRVTRKRLLPKPRYYLSAVTRRITLRKIPTKPIVLGEFWSAGNQPGGGWAEFLAPNESISVRLRIPEGGKPYEAMREWLFHRSAKRTKRPGAFDLNKTAQLWNSACGPEMKKERCGWIHLDGTRFVHWGEDLQRAIQVWEDSGYRGLRPYDVLVHVEADQHLPFIASHPRPDMPPDSRWLHVAVDLGRPIEQQLQEAQRICKEIRDYTLLLAGLKAKRPGRHQVRSDILAFTLHYSAGLTTLQIAQKLFPKGDAVKMERTVKDAIRRVRQALPPELLPDQPHRPRKTR